jgi:hypothetical protein
MLANIGSTVVPSHVFASRLGWNSFRGPFVVAPFPLVEMQDLLKSWREGADQSPASEADGERNRSQRRSLPPRVHRIILSARTMNLPGAAPTK